MKNFNILGVHRKIQLLGERGSSRKTSVEEGGCLKKGGAWTVWRFRGGGAWQEREWWCFLGGVDTPMHTMSL